MAHVARGAAVRVTAPIEPAVNEIAARIRSAAAKSAAMRIVGAGTWLDAGQPVSARETISTREHTGIVSYVPGDLTLTARAGTTLAEIREATAAHNQWLALDPFGTDEGTLGATVATGSAGPLATNFGTPRDLVLGLEFVTGRGQVARGGGKVVKNVAGFDLTRLMVGAWGTLGVITEVTVRLHSRPEMDATLAIETGDVGAVRTLLRRLPFIPYACEAINATLAATLLNNSSPHVLFRLGGNAESVAAQRAALSELGSATETDGDVWRRLRGAEPADALVVRYSDLPSRIDRTWSLGEGITGAAVSASPARGVVRVVVPSGGGSMPNIASVPEAVTVIPERLGRAAWPKPSWRNDGLPSRVKAAFDPNNLLNPGILGAAT